MARFLKPGLSFILFLALHIHDSHGEGGGYFGRYIGPLSRLNHGVSGEVYAVDARTLHIRDFTYDGEGPAAFFYAGNTKAVGPGGFFVRDDAGSNGVLRKYNKEHITLTLPDGKTLNNIRWFSVWCDEFAVNFGSIQIPRGLDYPKPQKIGALSGVHGVSSESIVVVDAQTLLIPSFSYDGEAPDAKFWVGRGSNPTPQGLRVPDENGKQNPLRRYDRKTIVLTLPGELTAFDIGHFGVWCEAFTVDFGHVQIPKTLNVPPSLKMLGVSPQSKLNCEVLSDDLAFEVRWAVAGDSIVIQLVAKLEEGEYMSFGLSGEDERSAMVGGDVVVAWVDHNTLNGYAHDYYLDAKSQCAGTHGSCPDANIDNNAESVRLLNAALVNGYSILTYQRGLRAHDGLDRPIFTNRSQPVIWAVGPLNSKNEVSYHSITSKGDIFMDFGRAPRWNCPIPQTDSSAEGSTGEGLALKTSSQPQKTKEPPAPSSAPTSGDWDIPPIQCNEPEDGVFYAQMGPTGGKKGYPAITGHVGWGIAIYINGLLIPEIHVVRGKTYTFVVEGGNEASVPAKFHPFYITDDPVGGYQYKTPEERRKVNIYAGAELDKEGQVVPTGIGRLCNWTPDPEQPPADEFVSFGAYQRTLTLVCDHGEPAVVQWTPDKDTPDTVYYQCFSHRYLGWKIHVHDRCDLPSVSGSDPVPSIAFPEEELQAKPSVQVTTRVKPDFPPQSISSSGNKKFPTKGNFPYAFMKPEPENKTHVIPVREEVEDFPESSTVKQFNLRGNSSNEYMHQSVPQMVHHGNTPMRVPFGNLRPPPTRKQPQVVMVRRPPQGPQVVMKPHMPHINMAMVHQAPVIHQAPVLHQAPSQPRPVIVKKPLMRLPPRPQVMQSRPALPPQPQVMQSRPAPPPQPQVMQSRPAPPPQPINRIPPKQVYIHKFKKTPSGAPLLEKNKIKMHPSQMISTNPEEISTKLPIAVNTGFNPGSLVIESGFKPIINAPQAAEERVSEVDYDDEEDNNEGVINLDSDEEQKSQTEMFEPMFIPSPLDSNAKHTKKATTEPLKKVRKPVRQVLRRRPVYEEPLFRSEPEDDEEAMADEKVETFVEPDHAVLTYDGKEVAGSVAPPVPIVPAPEKKGSDILKHMPQFGPFKGAPPPPVPKKVSPDFPQLKQASRPIALALKADTSSHPTSEKIEVVTAQQLEETDMTPENRPKRSAHHEPGHMDGESGEDEHFHHQSADLENGRSGKEGMNAGTPLTSLPFLWLACIYLALRKQQT